MQAWIRSRGQSIKTAVHILDLLKKTAVWLLLLCRRARYGYAFRLIPMAQPRYAKVDPADYERLRKYEWLAFKGKNYFYARRRVPTSQAKKRTFVYMHQMVIKVPEGMVADHINRDGMDNRSDNLRAATRCENMFNRKKSSKFSYSKYKGVSWRKKTGNWQVQIKFNKKRLHLGCFRDEIEAAKAYDRAARKYHGQFACLNFPD